MRNIVFWRGIEEANFKPTEGGFLYFPYGALGGGYVVTAEQKEKLGAFIRTYYLAATVLIIAQAAVAPFFGFYTLVGTFAMLAALLAWFVVGIRARVAGARRTDQRLGFGEAQRIGVRTMSNGRVAFTLAAGALLVLASVFALFAGMQSGDRNMTLIGVGTLVLFGLIFAMSCYTAWLKWGRHA
jgi:hypothetical protein